MAAMDPVVDFGMWVMNSKLMGMDNIVRDLIFRAVRHTFYEHFCAGENTVELANCMKRLNESGLRGMLDFAVEFTSDNDACDRNFHGFLDTIETAKTLPIFYPLTPEEEQHLLLGQQRLLKLCQACVEANIPLVIDAEHTTVQPAVDYFTYSSAIKCNKDDNPIVYGTIQAYLKDAKERLLLATNAADKMGVPMGFKLVRGAYMSSERKLASSLGYQSPIHNNIQQTHACYNDCASFLLESITNGSHGVILATHNVESGRLAAKKAEDLGIAYWNKKLEFAQLYGMAEALSFGLRNAGFQVSKYMPFGPVETAIPYLLRRAEENRGLLSASGLDRELTRKELGRRLKAAIL
ncbi:hypothetical protein GH714_013014 [Hevea brasiliensis]|uniref:Proline dehydrogenase n=1 Tax=Hevea brasiliensis TaxID=3981 RepID=A0A6A6MJ00_HEVBR|nr:hypothetical protein GH714_013014 [Hevea brasiliensis]